MNKNKKTIPIYSGKGRLIPTMYENIIAAKNKEIATLQTEIKRLNLELDRFDRLIHSF